MIRIRKLKSDGEKIDIYKFINSHVKKLLHIIKKKRKKKKEVCACSLLQKQNGSKLAKLLTSSLPFLENDINAMTAISWDLDVC